MTAEPLYFTLYRSQVDGNSGRNSEKPEVPMNSGVLETSVPFIPTLWDHAGCPGQLGWPGRAGDSSESLPTVTFFGMPHATALAKPVAPKFGVPPERRQWHPAE